MDDNFDFVHGDSQGLGTELDDLGEDLPYGGGDRSKDA
jgi:hypothetical protein